LESRPSRGNLFHMRQQFVPNDSSWVREHYATQDQLKVRILTHEIYSQPKIEFAGWVLDQATWQGTETVVDIGCGAGVYLHQARQRCRRYIGGDLSLGMLQSLPVGNYKLLNLDAMLLPFARDAVDVILANHMLYHVPNIRTAVSQFQRVLKPGGRLIAATNSSFNLLELKELMQTTAAHFGIAQQLASTSADFVWPFTLENGRDFLSNAFSVVERYDLTSALVFPTAEPLLAYIDSIRDLYLSFLPQPVTWSIFLEAVQRRLEDLLRENGEIRVRKHAGVFVCKN